MMNLHCLVPEVNAYCLAELGICLCKGPNWILGIQLAPDLNLYFQLPVEVLVTSFQPVPELTRYIL